MITELLRNDSPMLMPAVLIIAKSSAVLLIAFALTTLMQRASATSRHLVWVASLLAMLAIPALAAWSPIRFAMLPASWSASPVTSAPAESIGDRAVSADVTAQRDGARGDVSRAPAIAGTQPTDAGLTSSPASAPASAVFSLTLVVSLVWGAVLTAILSWLAFGSLSVRRIVRGATLLDGAEWQGQVIDIADRFELATMPRLLRSEGVTMPFACGVRTPTIVLPADCETWTPERRTAVLLHELAHIRRRDIIGHTLGRVVCALHWFNPLAWMAAKRLRAESERACDDLALGCGTRASDYAEHLLDIVTSARNHGTPSVAMAMATRSEFEGRMLAILDPSLMRAAPTRVQASTLAGGVMMFAIVAGSAVPRVAVTPEAGAQGNQVEAVTVDSRGVAPTPPTNQQNMALGADTSRRGRDRKPVELPIEMPESPEPIETPEPSPKPRPYPGWQSGSQRRADRIGAAATDADSSVRATVLARILRTDSAESLRRTAAWGLNDFAGEDVAIDALVYAVRRDASAEVREMAAWALSDATDDSRATAALAAAIRGDKDRSVRETAVWSLSSGADDGSAETITALSAVLSDEDPKVREMAAWGLGNASPRRAPAALVAALSDRSERVRKTVAWALFQIEDAESAGAIEAALQREMDADAKWAMVRAISVMGERAVEPLQRIIESGNAPLRALAIRALAGRGADPWPQPRPRPRPFP